jgi:hypothetical protein
VQGTIDMRHIGDVLDAVRIVEWMNPTLWTPEDDAGLRDWFQRYVEGWLIPQRIPRTERASENNHGNYYDVQLMSILKYLKRCVPQDTLLPLIVYKVDMLRCLCDVHSHHNQH